MIKKVDPTYARLKECELELSRANENYSGMRKTRDILDDQLIEMGRVIIDIRCKLEVSENKLRIAEGTLDRIHREISIRTDKQIHDYAKDALMIIRDKHEPQRSLLR